WAARLQAALPDLQVTIDDLIAEGDKVVVRSTRTGTHQAYWGRMGVAGQPALRAWPVRRQPGGHTMRASGYPTRHRRGGGDAPELATRGRGAAAGGAEMRHAGHLPAR